MPTINKFYDADPMAGILRGTIATAAYLNALGVPPTIVTPIRTVTASGIIDKDSDYILLIDATAGDIDLTLPSVFDCALSREFAVKRLDDTSAAVRLLPVGSETIDGDPSLPIYGKNAATRIKNADTAYWQTLQNAPPRMSVYTSAMTGDEAPTLLDGIITFCLLDPGAADRNFEPVITTGQLLVIVNQGMNLISCGSGSHVIAPGQWAFMALAGSTLTGRIL